MPDQPGNHQLPTISEVPLPTAQAITAQEGLIPGIRWQIGDFIQNRWEIRDIKRGGMGVVYIGYDNELLAPFAAKTFQDEVFARNTGIADRFRREATAWVQIDAHPNITQAHSVKLFGEKPLLFLEYVSGGDLGGWIGTPRLTEDLPQVLRFAIQFCDGMKHAVSKGITPHRDIKPQNCLITQDGTLKITDFGLAKVLGESNWEDSDWQGIQSEGRRSPSMIRWFGRKRPVEPTPKPLPPRHASGRVATGTGVAAGTAAYMSPEQFADVKNVDVRADIYSFGVMLFQMVTGQLPYQASTWDEYRRLHQEQMQPCMAINCPASSVAHQQLIHLVQRCLLKNPEDRYGGFGAVRERLAQVYQRLTGNPAPIPDSGPQLDLAQLREKAASLITLGCFRQAIQVYEAILNLDRADQTARLGKGSALLRLQRMEEAAHCFEHVLNYNPTHVEAWFLRGEALFALGKQTISNNSPDPSRPAFWRDARIAWDNGYRRYQEALECYCEAERLGHPEAAIAANLCRRALFSSQDTGQTRRL